jgi:hypothetical protein
MIGMKRIILLYCLFLGVFISVFSESSNSGKYVVITFTSDIDKHCGTMYYHWIIDSDSLKNRDVYMSPLHLDMEDSTLYSFCVDDNIFYSGRTWNGVYMDSYVKKQNELLSVILKHKRKLMSMKVNLANGKNENISICATPIIADFVACKSCCEKEHPKNTLVYILKDGSEFYYDDSFFQKKEDIEKLMIRFNFIDFRRTFETYSGRVAKIKE